ncbi:MAG: ABC transporter ATP-binding protein [Lachnospiraceae bacterium]|nr:ABC transporter ATP-binding protein [Lachnospiraceae bacterium]MBQ9610380.1 ABC transporter ATP-binding protein [Lachnospiraceae bacterium]
MDSNKDRNVVIHTEDLYKIYNVGDEKLHALDGVSFDIYEGEFVAIVGTSGSGKSTLLNMLAGLERPTKGSITVAGRRIDRLKEEQLVRFRRERVGFIFQSFNLIGTMNAVENVSMPLTFKGISKAKRLARANEMLDMVGLSKHKKHRPNQMSGGQQQRVGVARALVVNPSIIFADEPTGNLDSNTTKEILELMRSLVNEQHKTLVMVTHDRNLANVADRVIQIRDGRIKKIEVNEKKEIIEDEL